MADRVIRYVPAGPVVERFHLSDAFVRGLLGPVGSSKSSAACWEMYTRACEQAPYEGRRLTRWAVLRSTYPELKSTTIKTFMEWFGPLGFRLTWDSPITAVYSGRMGDGTVVEMEVLFWPMDRPEEVDKLSSLEITGAWINEAREMPIEALEKLTERVGRYPPRKWVSPTWRGVIMDTNAPDTDHWWFRLSEGSDPRLVEQMEMVERKLRKIGYLKAGQKLYEFFRQPGGLKRVGGELVENPEAENIENLDGGYAYYFRQAAGKNEEWIKAQILAEYATVTAGRPVYPEYNDSVHCREIGVLPKLPLIVGLDYGRTPAAVFAQITSRGQLRVVDELQGFDIGIEGFAEDMLKPHISQHYAEHDIYFVGDPAGLAKESDERSAFDVLSDCGVVAVPAHTNRLTGRLEAVKHYLGRMTDGQPAFALSRKCERLRRGCLGKYHYKRVQVGGERFKDVPEKDDYSHLQDAMQYAALYARMEYFKDRAAPIKYPSLGIV